MGRQESRARGDHVVKDIVEVLAIIAILLGLFLVNPLYAVAAGVVIVALVELSDRPAKVQEGDDT